MTLTPLYITDAEPDGPTFSVCSLVRSQDKYDRLLASFERFGFSGTNAEFLAADNREINRFDGYNWQRALLAKARGQFVIFTHDDIELIEEGFAELLGWTEWLDRNDPNWLVAGVAGGIWKADRRPKTTLSLHISDKNGNARRLGSIPYRVESLDECFILMRRTRPVISSYDLNGFHFYGPDMCLQAELLGGSAWTIDFHIKHSGLAHAGKPFDESRANFVAKYRQYFPGRFLNTVNGLVELR